MKIHYYADTDSLYIELNARAGADTVELGNNVRLDMDSNGQPVGIDIDHASAVLDLSQIESTGLPAVLVKAIA